VSKREPFSCFLLYDIFHSRLLLVFRAAVCHCFWRTTRRPLLRSRDPNEGPVLHRARSGRVSGGSGEF
jgi:hypothetical protein